MPENRKNNSLTHPDRFGDICAADDLYGNASPAHASGGLRTITYDRLCGPENHSQIRLHSGMQFDFLNPDPDAIDIVSIAHALSNLCRFTGHTDKFYSVAQHSVLVSRMLPPELQFAGLVHDAVEAFVGDVSKPLKNHLPYYQEIEVRVEKVIFEKYGVPYPLPPAVKEADKAILVYELRDLMGLEVTDLPEGFPALPAGCSRIIPLDPARAVELFLAQFSRLCPWGLYV